MTMLISHRRRAISNRRRFVLRSQSGSSRSTLNPVLIVEDNFSDTNGVSLDAHDLDLDPVGAGWTEYDWSQDVDLDIQSNKARLFTTVAASGYGSAMLDCQASDVIISADITLGTGGVSGTTQGALIARATERTTGWWIRARTNNDDFSIVERTTGTSVVRASTSVTLADGDTVSIEATFNGAAISATLDGANPISYSSSDALNETLVGIICNLIVPDQDEIFFDNFKVYSI